MPRLIGFQYTKKSNDLPGSKASSDQLLRIAEKSYLNSTRYGEYGNVNDVDGFLKQLSKLPQTPDVIEKTVDLNNKRAQIAAKEEDIKNQKNNFDYNLQVDLDNAAKTYIKDPKSLIQEYARIYGEAEAKYNKDVMSYIGQRYGAESKIPSDVSSGREKYKEKATWLSSTINAYNLYTNLDTEGIAFEIDTNPSNGSIVHVNIVPSGEIDKSNYMRTNVGAKVVKNDPASNIPMYLRTNDVGRTEDGMTIKGALLGNIKFKEGINVSGTSSKSLNELQPEKLAGDLKFWNDSPIELRNKSIDQINRDGVDFSTGDYKYDSLDIPNNSPVSVGQRLFYSTDKGELLEMSGKDNDERQAMMKKYLSDNNIKANLPYTTTSDYLKNRTIKGSIDSNYLNTQNGIPQPKWGGMQQSAKPQAQSASFTPTGDSFFAKPRNLNEPEQEGGVTTPSTSGELESKFLPLRNRQNKPDIAPITTKNKTSVSDLIDKGKSFFRNRLA